jgi:hypothetical protein
MCIILTISNHAAINVAISMSKRGVKAFKLEMSGAAFDIAYNSGSRDIIALAEAGKV